MKKGDILRSKIANRFAVCTTNEMASGYIGIIECTRGKATRLLSRVVVWEVIEFADGRINEALFPKNERAEDQRFEEEFYGVHGQPVRARGIPINAHMQGYAQVVAQRPRWEANPFDVEEDVVNEVGDHVDF